MKNKVLKAGIWYTISNFLIKGIAFIVMPIFTRIMSVNDIGAFSNVISWVGILSIITTFELYSSINLARFDYKDELDSYISSNLFLSTIITSIFYIIVLIFSDFFQNLFSMDLQTINLIFIYLLVYPALEMYQTKKRFQYEYKSVVLVSLISSIGASLISLACVLLCNNALLGRIYGFYIPSIIVAGIIYILLIIKGKKISKKYWKYALTISIPMIFHLLASNLLSSSDRIMISKLIDNNATALYTVAYSCSMVVSILWNSMNIAWSPWAYEMIDKKNYDKLFNKSKPYFIFFSMIVIIFMLLAPEILYIMGGKEYLGAVYIIPPVMVGFVFQFVYSLYFIIETYNRKQKNIAISTIIAAVVNVVLNYIFIPIFGYIAAAYTTLIGYMLLYVLHYLFVKKLNFEKCYDDKFFRKYLILFLIFIFILNVLYIFNIVRYIIISLLISYLFYKIISKKQLIIESIKNKNYLDILSIFNIRRY